MTFRKMLSRLFYAAAILLTAFVFSLQILAVIR